MIRLSTHPARPTRQRRRPAYPRLLGIGIVVVAAAACGGSSNGSEHPDNWPPAPGGVGPEYEEPIERSEPGGGEGGGAPLRVVPDEEEDEAPQPPGGMPGSLR